MCTGGFADGAVREVGDGVGEDGPAAEWVLAALLVADALGDGLGDAQRDEVGDGVDDGVDRGLDDEPRGEWDVRPEDEADVLGDGLGDAQATELAVGFAGVADGSLAAAIGAVETIRPTVIAANRNTRRAIAVPPDRCTMRC